KLPCGYYTKKGDNHVQAGFVEHDAIEIILCCDDDSNCGDDEGERILLRAQYEIGPIRHGVSPHRLCGGAEAQKLLKPSDCCAPKRGEEWVRCCHRLGGGQGLDGTATFLDSVTGSFV